jgi:hypothetical protein
MVIVEANAPSRPANQKFAPFLVLVDVLPDFWELNLEVSSSGSLRNGSFAQAHDNTKSFRRNSLGRQQSHQPTADRH